LFESDRGLSMLVVCGLLMVAGIYWMRKIIRIEI
jgi:Flp pilus assembly protein TadB